MTQTTFLPIYLMDTSPIVRLDGKDNRPPTPPDFTVMERALIWDGLEALAKDGRLKLIKQVRDELKAHNPDGLARLTAYKPAILNIYRTADVWIQYQRIVSIYKGIAPKPGGRAIADPWLIVAAKRYGFTVVTMELSLQARAPTAPRKL